MISMLTVYHQITIKTLDKQGKPKTHIAREMGCHRNTVRNVIRREKVIEKQIRHKPSYFDTYRDKIKELLDKPACAGRKVSRLRIHEILQEEYGVDKSYDNLCKYIQKNFPKPVPAFGVQMTEPGEMAEVDFGYLGMLPNLSGQLVKTWGLAMVLGYSREIYCEATYDQKIGTLLFFLKNGFEFFGGVPKRLKVDNMKTAILKNQHYDLEFNQDFLEFTHHYSTVIVPCAPYHPEQKGKVESGIKYLQNNFVKGRQFTDGDDLKNQLMDWVVNVANQRKHGTTKKIPEAVFQSEEKERLPALPGEEFSFFQRGVRKVQANCHIHFENNYYSVPSLLAGKEVTVRWNEHLIRIIYEGEQVALHQLNKSQGEYVTIRSHLPDYKTYSQTEYQARYEEKMADIGDWAHQYFKQILQTNPNYWSRTIKGILGLAKQYGQEAVDLSLGRAWYYRVTDLVTIRNICEKRLYLHGVEPKFSLVELVAESHTQLPAGQMSAIKQVVKQKWLDWRPPRWLSLPTPEQEENTRSMSRDLSYYSP